VAFSAPAILPAGTIRCNSLAGEPCGGRRLDRAQLMTPSSARKTEVKMSRRIMLVVLTAALTGPAQAQLLKKEPGMGSLKPGQVVYVDDGTCPAGQVKQIVGGDHKKVGGKAEVERRRSCVAR
jgi:uncharacterized protein DUF6719